jgi:hypothetical protein
MAQCWIEYQFRYLSRVKGFSYAVDPKWEALYRGILKNKAAGGVFEEEILKANKYEKNIAMMLPPPESGMDGFIADSVLGNPEELSWGKPYHFVEIKGRQDMALTGNLEAMLKYVQKYGGHIEVWFRSAKHSAGATKLTGPLERTLADLEKLGLANVRRYPL